MLRSTLPWLALAVLLAAAPAAVASYPRYVILLCMIFSIAAIGLNFVVGYAAMYSLAQGAFMLLGAYVTAIAIARWHVPAPATLIFAPALAAAVAALIGIPVLRLRGLPLAILTFAFALVTFDVVKSFDFTGGPSGLFIAPTALASAADGQYLYEVTVIVFLLAIGLARSMTVFRTGRALRVTAANEIAARSLGINVFRYQYIVFILSAIYAGVAGALLGLATGYVAPEVFAPELSINLFAAVMIGGAGTLAGPVIGASFIVLVPELTGAAQSLSAIVYSAVFLGIAIAFPSGIAGMARGLHWPGSPRKAPA